MMTSKIVRTTLTTAARYQTLIKLLPLMLLLLALASGVIADGMPGGSICPGC